MYSVIFCLISTLLCASLCAQTLELPFFITAVAKEVWVQPIIRRCVCYENHRPDAKESIVVMLDGSRVPLQQVIYDPLNEGFELVFEAKEGHCWLVCKDTKEGRTAHTQLVFSEKEELIDGEKCDLAWWHKRQVFLHGVDLFFKDMDDTAAPIYCVECRATGQWLSLEQGLVWSDKKWQEVDLGSDSEGLLLLTIDANAQMTLWSPLGRQSLKISSRKEVSLPSKIVWNLKYIGRKSASKWQCEDGAQKISIQKNDWWLCSEGKWRKLATFEEIYSYLQRQVRGELLVIDDLVVRQGKRFIIGRLYNSMRTCVTEVQWPLMNKNSAPPPKPTIKNQ